MDDNGTSYKIDLIDQIGFLLAQADADPAAIFDSKISSDTDATAGVNISNFISVLYEYRQTLSVPQTICNSMAVAMDTDLIKNIYPTLVQQALELPFAPHRRGFIDEMEKDGFIENSAPTDANILRDQLVRESIAAQSPVFSFPKKMEKDDILSVCRDIDLLLECYRQSWEMVYHNQPADEDPDDLYTDDDRAGFYGALQWIGNLTESVREQAGLKKGFVDLKSVENVGNQKFKPSGLKLN